MDNPLNALNSFALDDRRDALEALFDQAAGFPAERPWVNMHMHTFLSFNGEGHSPSRLAWEAKNSSLYGVAICDFDVLTGLREFRDATDLLQLRSAVGFETRTFFSEYADHEINSPGEPGVFYFMGMGFVREPLPESSAGRTLKALQDKAQQRNRELLDRLNAELGELGIDYDTEVLPLTPTGNATERHIIRAYYDKALDVAGHDSRVTAQRWADKLALDVQTLVGHIGDPNAFSDILRSKLIKKGGLGYVQPTEDTFPLLDDVIGLILESDAIPVSTWLDGTSSGESDPHAQLECLMDKGIAAANIIPDRNWNLKDPDVQAVKIKNLHDYVKAAEDLNLPINVGTELNKPGQRFVDDFEAEPMRPCHEASLRGAQVMVGHTRLLRYAGFSYTGAPAKAEFASAAERNSVFASVGALPGPPLHTRRRLADLPPAQAFDYLMDSARAEKWR